MGSEMCIRDSLSTLRQKRQQVVAQDESFDLYEIDLSDENTAE